MSVAKIQSLLEYKEDMTAIEVVTEFTNQKVKEKMTLFDKVIVNVLDDESIWKMITTENSKKKYVIDPNIVKFNQLGTLSISENIFSLKLFSLLAYESIMIKSIVFIIESSDYFENMSEFHNFRNRVNTVSYIQKMNF